MITQNVLKELLHYDPETGAFIWNVSKGKASEWLQAGYIDDRDYRQITLDCKRYKAAVLAFLYMTGKMPIKRIYHMNKIKHDDRWENLRHGSARYALFSIAMNHDGKRVNRR